MAQVIDRTVTISKDYVDPETGEVVLFKRTEESKGKYYNVTNITTRINAMDFMEAQAITCRSSKDITILRHLLDMTDNTNKIVIMNIARLVTKLDTSRKSLMQLLSRGEESKLLHKTGTGEYLVNPFMYMGKRLAKRIAEQEQAQLNWAVTTGLIAPIALKHLAKLDKHMNMILEPTEFNLSVASYYSNNGRITDRQRDALLAHN